MIVVADARRVAGNLHVKIAKHEVPATKKKYVMHHALKMKVSRPYTPSLNACKRLLFF